MYFELLHTDTFNVVGDFPSVEEALALVRRIADERGGDIAEPLALARIVPGQPMEEIATGWDLIKMARAASPAAHRSAAT